jgi:DNA processing protein
MTHRWTRGERFPIPDADGLDEMCDAELPRVLLGEGERPDALDAPRIAIVGTRAATPLGIADAYEIATFCARAGITVISGLALGIDAAAHEGALDAGGLTVGVVATGLDVVYPLRHRRLYERVREQGLILTEHPPGTQPLPWRFPFRNRIIAALADGVLVVEAARKGGAISTANHAVRFNRELFVLPGSRRNPAAAGCNLLLRDGAHPLLEPSDLLGAIGRSGTLECPWKPPPKPPADRDQRAVLRAMSGEAASVDELQQRTGFPLDRLGPALRMLERAGRVVRRRGLYWLFLIQGVSQVVDQNSWN